MNYSNTALILIGFQNDYFSSDGILRTVIEESGKVTNILANTIDLISKLSETVMPIVATPIMFTENYQELDDEPVGILRTIKEMGAFQTGKPGSQTIPELLQFDDRIDYIAGKHGLNAFSNTELEIYLRARNIKNLLIAGTVTSICIDSTARCAAELGFNVMVLSDCTSSRTIFEQEFYCKNIFPIYAKVLDHNKLIFLMRFATF